MPRIQRKPKGAYHHPDLENALVSAAARTIGEEGVAALTLRGVGERLGVSRTALYRHFPDKSALVARVALEGFRRFRAALQAAVDEARLKARDPMEEMGVAYIAFALDNQPHYQTMFGNMCGDWSRYPDLAVEADAAFSVLLETITAEQSAGRVVTGDARMIAEAVWSAVHGQATLTINGHLDRSQFEELARFSWRHHFSSSASQPARGVERRSRASD